jgi:hypothetical protein
MSVGSALVLERSQEQPFAKSDLLRLEGLGDNCELGFVLRRMGFEGGMLFRWASIRPESLLATLRGDFAGMYDFDNLVPQNPKMVRDLHYGTSWHTQMQSSLRSGTLTFDTNQEDRRPIHRTEAGKLAYLLEKLRAKFKHPNPVFVIKANNGIAEDLLEAIHYQIYRRAISPHFLLREVQSNMKRAGTVDLLDRNRMRGFVTRFAPYDRADQGDDQNWIAVLRQALAHSARTPMPPSSAIPAGAPEAVLFPFPEDTASDFRASVIRDLRGGMPSLIGGNAWCRTIDQDAYRLHATGLDSGATRLQWTGVYFPPEYGVTIRAGLAVKESLTVRAVLEIAAPDGTAVRAHHVFDTMTAQTFVAAEPVHFAGPLTVSLGVEPLRPLKAGECAAIDITSVRAAPV